MLKLDSSGYSALFIIPIVVVVILLAGFLIKNQINNEKDVVPSPNPSAVSTMSALPSTTVKATFKPVIKPTNTPTATLSPTPSPTPPSTQSSNSNCNNGQVSVNIQPDNGSVVGDTLVRVSVNSNFQECNANSSKEEILRNGQSSITINDLTPATYNLMVGYHGKQYNETFTISSGGNISKTVNVTN